MSEKLPASMHAVDFGNPIWGLLYEPSQNLLFVDCRDEETKEIALWSLNCSSLDIHRVAIELEWWERSIGVAENHLYSVKYLDPNDPTRFQFRCFDLTNSTVEMLDAQPVFPSPILEPSLYEVGSEHHQTVAQFLALELEMPCEYLEIEDKIIISYYLRSSDGFDRFVLFIEGGSKQWKVKQDVQMKGFASGSFFVVNEQLIFVKDRNEVCMFSL